MPVVERVTCFWAAGLRRTRSLIQCPTADVCAVRMVSADLFMFHHIGKKNLLSKRSLKKLQYWKLVS